MTNIDPAMTNIDYVLRPWIGASPPAWSSEAALRLAQRVASDHDMTVSWEPGDEEWIRLVIDDVRAMIHIRYPFAVATADLAPSLRTAPGVRVVAVNDIDAEELAASPDVLRATVLPYMPWSEDFDPSRFSAIDLFLESV